MAEEEAAQAYFTSRLGGPPCPDETAIAAAIKLTGIAIPAIDDIDSTSWAFDFDALVSRVHKALVQGGHTHGDVTVTRRVILRMIGTGETG